MLIGLFQTGKEPRVRGPAKFQKEERNLKAFSFSSGKESSLIRENKLFNKALPLVGG